MSSITGYVEKIVYRNEDNAYCVLEVSGVDDENNEDTFVIVGTFPTISEGNHIKAEGTFKVHQIYGEQLAVTSYEITEPEDEKSIERYLASGAVKGIGDALASRIVRKFGKDTIRIMEEEPERLSEVKGISERMAISFAVQVEAKKDMRDAMLFLSGYGISMNVAVKIYKQYGSLVYTILKENPYRLAEDISGIGFKTADEIAIKAGIAVDSRFRIKAGMMYVLTEAMGRGHMYLPKEELLKETSELLETESIDEVEEQLSEMQMEKKIIVKGNDIYTSTAYFTELSVARLLHDINLENPIRIITGGPGTGKTTNIKKLIEQCERDGLEYSLAAPTGRAAKRMTEATGREASTIHRLLEVSVASMMDDKKDEYAAGGLHFERNEDNPLDADVVIIDEMSMVDIFLMNALLHAVSVGTKLVLVGDMNQLPSVGPGNVLADVIASDCFDVTFLNKIYRQDNDSDIVANAHRMINEEQIDLSKKSRDFLFIRREDSDQIISAMLTLLREKLPAYVDAKTSEIQIMTPMRKGLLGVERLNRILQGQLNPPSNQKKEKELNGVIFREGDKVMQIKNNYNIRWVIRGFAGLPIKTGEGIYNGDIGTIKEINSFAQTVTIEYDDERLADYEFSEMDEVEHAYAITIHKSQGSEYPAAIIPVSSGPEMLMTRNLIYTAVTRAIKCVCLVGSEKEFYHMVENTHEMTRYSGLRDRIEEIFRTRD